MKHTIEVDVPEGQVAIFIPPSTHALDLELLPPGSKLLHDKGVFTLCQEPDISDEDRAASFMQNPATTFISND